VDDYVGKKPGRKKQMPADGASAADGQTGFRHVRWKAANED